MINNEFILTISTELTSNEIKFKIRTRERLEFSLKIISVIYI